MCAGWRQGKYPKKGKYLGESDEIFIVCRGENCLLVNTGRLSTQAAGRCQRRILTAHCPSVRVFKRPSSCLTTLSSLLVPICQWTRFLDISYKQFLQSHDPGPKKHPALHFFPPKDNPFMFYHTLMMWICWDSLCLSPSALCHWSGQKLETIDDSGQRLLFTTFYSPIIEAQKQTRSLNTDGSIYYYCQYNLKSSIASEL